MKISNSELQVMDALWSEHPLTVGQVIDRLQQQCDWQESTIKTLLTRLIQKEAIARHKVERRYLYEPLISRKAYLTNASEGFLKQFFNGEMAPLVAHFAESKKLSSKDIIEIENILNKLKEPRDD
jgi:BlaI family penicillinase repressor